MKFKMPTRKLKKCTYLIFLIISISFLNLILMASYTTIVTYPSWNGIIKSKRATDRKDGLGEILYLLGNNHSYNTSTEGMGSSLGSYLYEDELDLVDPISMKKGIDDLNSRHPNLPLDFVLHEKVNAQIPSLSELNWAGRDWQVYTNFFEQNLYLYSAFYDNRNHTKNRPNIRIVSATEQTLKAPNFGYCIIWNKEDGTYNSSKIESAGVIHYKKIKSGVRPYLLTCPIPTVLKEQINLAVSVVEKLEENPYPKNLLKIIGLNAQTIKTQFSKKETLSSKNIKLGICTAAIFFYMEDYSKKLVEWMEIMRALKVDKIFLYKTTVHPNIEKVLNFYERINFADVTSFSYAPTYPDNPVIRRIWSWNQRQQIFSFENIHFTDCVLRHMNTHRFIAHWDFDEVPFLHKHQNISELINYILWTTDISPAAYRLRPTHFYQNLPPGKSAEDIPSDFYILRHNQREKKVLKRPPKPIYDMKFVTAVASHDVVFCNNGPCENKSVFILNETAYLCHVRRICDENCTAAVEYKEENFLAKYRDQVIENSMKIWNLLDL